MPTIQEGRDAIDEGNLQMARLMFEAILEEDKRNEDAWLGLAEVLPETEDKRICYENVLKINKNSIAAKEGLRNLEPQANPLIEALQPKAEPSEAIDETSSADETVVSATPDDTVAAGVEADAAQPGNGPPTYALVAVGLLLSVVFFAVGGGLVFFIISAAR